MKAFSLKGLLGLVLAALLGVLCAALVGCKAAGNPVPPPPPEPYLHAEQVLGTVAQVLVEAQQAITAMHSLAYIDATGASVPMLDDQAYAQCQAWLHASSVDGMALSSLLLTKAPPVAIAAQFAVFSADVAAHLDPTAVGIKNATSQVRYRLIVTSVGVAVDLLAAAIDIIVNEGANAHAGLRSDRNPQLSLGRRSSGTRGRGPDQADRGQGAGKPFRQQLAV